MELTYGHVILLFYVLYNLYLTSYSSNIPAFWYVQVYTIPLRPYFGRSFVCPGLLQLSTYMDFFNKSLKQINDCYQWFLYWTIHLINQSINQWNELFNQFTFLIEFTSLQFIEYNFPGWFLSSNENSWSNGSELATVTKLGTIYNIQIISGFQNIFMWSRAWWIMGFFHIML